MIGIDTNVLIRFLVRDDRVQFEKSQRFLRRRAEHDEHVYISHLVLMETEWVLRSRYLLEKDDIAAAFTGLLESSDLLIENAPAVEQALYLWASSTADFTDCLIGTSNLNAGCRGTATFDARASKLPGYLAL